MLYEVITRGQQHLLRLLLGPRVGEVGARQQHARLSKVMDALLRESVERASYKGAKVQTLSLAARNNFV